jgi:hypothetical protein
VEPGLSSPRDGERRGQRLSGRPAKIAIISKKVASIGFGPLDTICSAS